MPRDTSRYPLRSGKKDGARSPATVSQRRTAQRCSQAMCPAGWVSPKVIQTQPCFPCAAQRKTTEMMAGNQKEARKVISIYLCTLTWLLITICYIKQFDLKRTNTDAALTFPPSLHTPFLTPFLQAVVPEPAWGRCSASLLGQLISCRQLTSLNEACLNIRIHCFSYI